MFKALDSTGEGGNIDLLSVYTHKVRRNRSTLVPCTLMTFTLRDLSYPELRRKERVTSPTPD